MNGTYNFQSHIQLNLALTNASATPTTFNLISDKEPIFSCTNPAPTPTGIELLHFHTVNITGIRFQNCTSSPATIGAVLHVFNSSKVVLSDIQVLSFSSQSPNGIGGISILSVSEVQIYGSLFQKCSGSLVGTILFSQVQNTSISGCVFDSNGNTNGASYSSGINLHFLCSCIDFVEGVMSVQYNGPPGSFIVVNSKFSTI